MNKTSFPIAGERLSELEQKTYDLRERVKELDCLYGLTRLIVQPGKSPEQILRGAACLIPPGWQYPEITVARITLEGERYASAGFKTTAWRQDAAILVDGTPAGQIEVCYLEQMPDCDEGPFLREERHLLNAFAGHLGAWLERIRREEELRASEAELRQQKRSLEEKNIALREVLHQIEVERNQFRSNILTNIEELILPKLDKIRMRSGSQKYLSLLRQDLEEVASSFGKEISSRQMRLTPQEIEICNMIKRGLKNKEIARLLAITRGTVEKHRANIRRKIRLVGAGINLTTYLKNL